MDLIDFPEELDLFIERRPSIFRPRIDAFNEYDDNDFMKRYRFTKNGVNDLIFLLRNDLKRNTNRRKAISVQHQILTALRFYGSGGPYQLLDGDCLGLSQPTVSRAITAVSTALCRRVDDYIKIPEAGYAEECIRGFYAFARFPGVVGCVDGTHVRIVSPSQNPEQFRNRKGFPSINVQVVCDHRFKFTNIVAKWPGSSHDSFILRQSRFWDYFEENRQRGIILGDSAYPSRYWLMKPYPNPNTRPKKRFNVAHKSTRAKVENTIGQWKRRFGLLHEESRRSLRNVLLDTIACAILHNIAKDSNEPIFIGPDIEDNLGDNNEVAPNVNVNVVANIDNTHRADAGSRRRDIIANAHFNFA